MSLPVVASAGVRVRADLRDPSRTLFPSDHFTVADFTQNTFQRVHLPKPDCRVQPVACEDIEVLNTLDGFNLQPRLTIPFSGAIDVASVSSDTIFLVSLGSSSARTVSARCFHSVRPSPRSSTGRWRPTHSSMSRCRPSS
jgi:hypothetical protein